MSKTTRIKGYLIVSRSGSIRAVKNKTSLDWDEIALGIDLRLPIEAFRPQLSVNADLTESDFKAEPIPFDLCQNIAEGLSEALGCKISLTQIENDKE